MNGKRNEPEEQASGSWRQETGRAKKPLDVRSETTKFNCVNGKRSTVNGRGGRPRRLETGGRRLEAGKGKKARIQDTGGRKQERQKRRET